MQSPVWLTESVHGELAPIVWGFHVAVPDNGHSSAFVSCFCVGTEDLLFGVSLTQSKLSLKTKILLVQLGHSARSQALGGVLS